MYCVRQWFALRTTKECVFISYKIVVDDVHQNTWYSLYKSQKKISVGSVPGIVVILMFLLKKLRLIEIK